ncbi:heme ABC exporter ATP-binding protein CcmA [Dongia sp.]|uniref:heme ABC exporter ATP-binding protein CcmA n=1 Tax=Dongia sp. TaxID=1977262 RepID=UPI0035B4DC97
MSGKGKEGGLVATDIACRRAERLLFSALNFALGPGDALMLRGPNGSGKSSLLRLLAGLLPAESGSLSWRGQPVEKDRAAYRADIAYLGHLDALKPQLLVRENLAFWADLVGGTVGVDAALAKVGLTPCADFPAQHLSAGQRRRFGLARLLLKPVPIWLLDEPTTALDVAGVKLVTDLIARHLAAGGLAIISSHDQMALPNARTLTLGSAA